PLRGSAASAVVKNGLLKQVYQLAHHLLFQCKLIHSKSDSRFCPVALQAADADARSLVPSGRHFMAWFQGSALEPSAGKALPCLHCEAEPRMQRVPRRSLGTRKRNSTVFAGAVR